MGEFLAGVEGSVEIEHCEFGVHQSLKLGSFPQHF